MQMDCFANDFVFAFGNNNKNNKKKNTKLFGAAER